GGAPGAAGDGVRPEPRLRRRPRGPVRHRGDQRRDPPAALGVTGPFAGRGHGMDRGHAARRPVPRRKRAMSIAVCLVPMVLLAAQAPAAEQRRVLTFEEAVTRALSANPGLNSAREEVHAAEALRRGTLSAVLPRLTANVSMIRNSDEVA